MACQDCLQGTNVEPCCGEMAYGSPMGSSLVYPEKPPVLQTAALAGLGYAFVKMFGDKGGDPWITAAGLMTSAFSAGVLWHRWCKFKQEEDAAAGIESVEKPWLASGVLAGTMLAAPYLGKSASFTRNLRYGAGSVAVMYWANYKMKQNALESA